MVEKKSQDRQKILLRVLNKIITCDIKTGQWWASAWPRHHSGGIWNRPPGQGWKRRTGSTAWCAAQLSADWLATGPCFRLSGDVHGQWVARSPLWVTPLYPCIGGVEQDERWKTEFKAGNTEQGRGIIDINEKHRCLRRSNDYKFLCTKRHCIKIYKAKNCQK